VIDVALLGIIRRWHLRDQVPLREIAKRLGISRNTVRRYLRSETTEPAYAERQSASAIDPYAFQLSGWLKTEAAKSRKQRRSLKQLHEDLSELGFKGSYDRVAAFARQWREGQTEWVNSARKRTAYGLPLTLNLENHSKQIGVRILRQLASTRHIVKGAVDVVACIFGGLGQHIVAA
jgi:transcriptional regulator with XRE-family HTH domain